MPKKENSIHKKKFIDSITKGLADVESGNIYTTEELKAVLEKNKSAEGFKMTTLLSTLRLQKWDWILMF